MEMERYVDSGFVVAQVFRDNERKINQFDFSFDGKYLISSSEDHQINVYNCYNARHKKTVYSKKYGVDRICFAHTNTTVLHTSTQINHSIRYLSLFDNKYIRYFEGHTRKVVSLCKSPINDMFLSGAIDNTIKVWDLRTPNYEGFVRVPGRPVITNDPEGKVMVVGLNSEMIMIYDVRQLDKGPFVSMRYGKEVLCDWTDLKFSPDGRIILISTNGPKVKLVDGYNGQPIMVFSDFQNNKGIPIEASFSPDSRYIAHGSTDGKIHLWDLISAEKVSILDGNHTGPVQCVKFNPKYAMIASACNNMAFWLPY